MIATSSNNDSSTIVTYWNNDLSVIATSWNNDSSMIATSWNNDCHLLNNDSNPIDDSSNVCQSWRTEYSSNTNIELQLICSWNVLIFTGDGFKEFLQK